MLCDRCGKNTAVVHKIITINGNKQELHLCKECAMEEKGAVMDDPFSIHALLSSLLDVGIETPIKFEKLETLKCDHCGGSFGQFKQAGRLGCSRCYQVFKDRLLPLLERIHGNTHHSGKIPRRKGGTLTIKREIAKLKAQLEKAVQAEEYERAAQLRDRIRELTNQL